MTFRGAPWSFYIVVDKQINAGLNRTYIYKYDLHTKKFNVGLACLMENSLKRLSSRAMSSMGSVRSIPMKSTMSAAVAARWIWK